MNEQLAWIIGTGGILIMGPVVTILFAVWSKTTKAIEENTKSLIVLETKINIMWGSHEKIPKMRADLDSAFEKLREYKEGNPN